MKQHIETVQEEIANSITHGVGALLSVSAMSILVVLAYQRGDPWRMVSFSIYGATLVIMYLSSTFYHAFPFSGVKRVFKILDHAAIFLLIAGSYTPFCLVTLRGAWGWSIFGVVWGIALFGIVFKAIFPVRFRFTTTVLYLFMGLIIVIAVKPLLANLPRGGLTWIAMGGASYVCGIAFYLWDSLPFSHTVWHLFVLGGSALHFFGILFYVLPM